LLPFLKFKQQKRKRITGLRRVFEEKYFSLTIYQTDDRQIIIIEFLVEYGDNNARNRD